MPLEMSRPNIKAESGAELFTPPLPIVETEPSLAPRPSEAEDIPKIMSSVPLTESSNSSSLAFSAAADTEEPPRSNDSLATQEADTTTYDAGGNWGQQLLGNGLGATV